MADEEPWLSLSEAAQRSGLAREAIRAKARRGRIPARKGNNGQILVQLPAVLLAGAGQGEAGAQADLLADLLAEVAELREQVARTEAERDAAESVAEAQVEAARDAARARVERGQGGGGCRARAGRPADGRAGGAAPAVVAEADWVTPYERAALLIDLQLGLRRVPAETLRAMLKPRRAWRSGAGEDRGLGRPGLPGAMRVEVSAPSAATDSAGRIAGQAHQPDPGLTGSFRCGPTGGGDARGPDHQVPST